VLVGWVFDDQAQSTGVFFVLIHIPHHLIGVIAKELATQQLPSGFRLKQQPIPDIVLWSISGPTTSATTIANTTTSQLHCLMIEPSPRVFLAIILAFPAWMSHQINTLRQPLILRRFNMENKHPYDMTVEELLTVNINHIIHNLPLRQIKQTGIKELMEELQSANNDLEIAELHADILAAAHDS